MTSSRDMDDDTNACRLSHRPQVSEELALGKTPKFVRLPIIDFGTPEFIPLSNLLSSVASAGGCRAPRDQMPASIHGSTIHGRMMCASIHGSTLGHAHC